MAITTKEEGVWSIDQVYAKQNQGSIWDYSEGFNLFSTGQNSHGALGVNDRTNRSSPIQITGSWVASTSSTNASKLHIKKDKTLWAVGLNEYGSLGQNSNQKFSSPTQIPGSWVAISSGSQIGAVTGIKDDGTMWSWGQNEYGQLGINKSPSDFNFVSSPTQVPGTTWSTITTTTQLAQGGYTCHALKTDGTLWAWGYNAQGNLGQNNKTNYSSPVQIPGTTWSSVAHGFMNGMAFKTDGTLWVWGNNG